MEKSMVKIGKSFNERKGFMNQAWSAIYYKMLATQQQASVWIV